MSVVEPIRRNFKMEDLAMLEKAQIFRDSHIIDEALFAAAFQTAIRCIV